MARPVSEEEIRTAESVFKEYLRDRRYKYTAERRAMFHAAMNTHEHFDAERMIVELRQQGHRVGRATVYRTLPLLENCGIIKEVSLGQKQTFYEHIHGHGSHDHMVCRRCGRILEFDNAAVVELRKLIARQYEFHDLSHRLQVQGLCKTCWQACPATRKPILHKRR